MRLEILKADVSSIIAGMTSLLTEVDKKALTKNTDMGRFVVDTVNESLKIGCDGWVDDDLAFINPWGFELKEIKVPVIIYHGDEDKLAPFAHGEWLAKNLPQEFLRKHLVQGEGHLSLFLERTDDMIDELLGIAKL
jgi:pimeloyl-ACP methyl ester carboxylesterase